MSFSCSHHRSQTSRLMTMADVFRDGCYDPASSQAFCLVSAFPCFNIVEIVRMTSIQGRTNRQTLMLLCNTGREIRPITCDRSFSGSRLHQGKGSFRIWHGPFSLAPAVMKVEEGGCFPQNTKHTTSPHPSSFTPTHRKSVTRNTQINHHLLPSESHQHPNNSKDGE